MKNNTKNPMVTLVLEEFGREFKPKSHDQRLAARNSKPGTTKNS
ncbi:hypothetical protein [Solidesulfovibrio sp.]|nr:hypothetical protein [Solidesulfovibrio sp.]MEA5088916.1 hypothetical protein [Solidesulfovibrio sp.]HML62445.1 hypothetical protein [Solidesulfovibrio sp.]